MKKILKENRYYFILFFIIVISAILIGCNGITPKHTLVIQPGPDEGKDSEVNSKYPNTNYGDWHYGAVGK